MNSFKHLLNLSQNYVYQIKPNKYLFMMRISKSRNWNKKMKKFKKTKKIKKIKKFKKIKKIKKTKKIKKIKK